MPSAAVMMAITAESNLPKRTKRASKKGARKKRKLSRGKRLANMYCMCFLVLGVILFVDYYTESMQISGFGAVLTVPAADSSEPSPPQMVAKNSNTTKKTHLRSSPLSRLVKLESKILHNEQSGGALSKRVALEATNAAGILPRLDQLEKHIMSRFMHSARLSELKNPSVLSRIVRLEEFIEAHPRKPNNPHPGRRARPIKRIYTHSAKGK
jgi:hypothetical protein